MKKGNAGEDDRRNCSPSEEEKIEMITRAGRAKDLDKLEEIIDLFEDPASRVRYFALCTAVLDLDQKTEKIREVCLKRGREDSDEEVRQMAVACIGSIEFGSRSVDIFDWLVDVLKQEESDLVKTAAYRAVFQLIGRPPSEWPNFRRRSLLKDEEIDFEVLGKFRQQLIDTETSQPSEL